MEKKIQKICLKYYNLLIAAQDLWQAHYQILSIIFLTKFIELNEYLDVIINKAKLLQLIISIVSVFL